MFRIRQVQKIEQLSFPKEPIPNRFVSISS